MAANEHIRELLKLPVEERAHAAKLLLDSLDGESEANAEGEWAIEIERRIAKIESGEADLRPMDEAVARLHRAARGQ